MDLQAQFASSWTWIMWFVTLGSILVVIFWIIVYSTFNSINFNNEAFNLFPTVDFLASVVLSIVLALGKHLCLLIVASRLIQCRIAPRYIYKYAQQTYWPLDKQIVREMWVAGDLKDRLGISHRSKRSSPTETAALFHRHNTDYQSEVELPTLSQYGPRAPTLTPPGPRDERANLMKGVSLPPSPDEALSPSSSSPYPLDDPSNARTTSDAMHNTSHLAPTHHANTRSQVASQFEDRTRPGSHGEEASHYSYTSQAMSFVTADEWEEDGSHSRMNSSHS